MKIGVVSAQAFKYSDPLDPDMRLATSAPFTLNPTGPTVLAATTPTVQGSALNIVWSGITAPTPYDWVAIYAVGANDTAYTRWAYIGGAPAGSVNLSLTHANLVPGGSYEVRLFANDDYTRLATSGSFVLASLAGTAASSTLYYVHTDHLGTPTALTNEAGTKVWSATHDPFGLATVNEDPDGNGQAVAFNVRFPGQYYDAESGLHYNYFRTYDPGTGRYLESDPIGLEGGLNTYGYVEGNPINYVDPTGELPQAIVGALTGASIDIAVQLIVNGGRFECIKWSTVAIAAGLGAVNPFSVGSALAKADKANRQLARSYAARSGSRAASRIGWRSDKNRRDAWKELASYLGVEGAAEGVGSFVPDKCNCGE